jgi:hypothetical protein
VRTGHLNSDLLPEEQKHRSAVRIGAELCRLFGMDPTRYSDAYLAGAALAAATTLGAFFSLGFSTMDLAETPEDRHAQTVFREAMRGT